MNNIINESIIIKNINKLANTLIENGYDENDVKYIIENQFFNIDVLKNIFKPLVKIKDFRNNVKLWQELKHSSKMPKEMYHLKTQEDPSLAVPAIGKLGDDPVLTTAAGIAGTGYLSGKAHDSGYFAGLRDGQPMSLARRLSEEW